MKASYHFKYSNPSEMKEIHENIINEYIKKNYFQNPQLNLLFLDRLSAL